MQHISHTRTHNTLDSHQALDSHLFNQQSPASHTQSKTTQDSQNNTESQNTESQKIQKSA